MELNYIEVITNILREYDIGDLVKIHELIRREYTGNLVIKIETSNGFYILKSYYKVKTYRMIDMLNHIKELKNELPLPLILTKKKSPFVICDDYIYSIDKFIIGKPNIGLDWSRENMVKQIELLAKLHKISTRNVVAKVTQKVRSAFFIETLWKEHKNSDEGRLLDRIKEKPNKSDFDKFVCDKIAPELLKQYRKYDLEVKLIEKIKRNKVAFSHGDLNPYNWIIDEEGFINLIDYESLSEDYHGYEMMDGALMIVPFSRSNGFNLDNLKLFVQTYKNVYGEIDLTSQEAITFLRHSLLRKITAFIKFYVKNSVDDNSKLVMVYYEKFLWLNSNENNIKKIFGISLIKKTLNLIR